MRRKVHNVLLSRRKVDSPIRSSYVIAISRTRSLARIGSNSNSTGRAGRSASQEKPWITSAR